MPWNLVYNEWSSSVLYRPCDFRNEREAASRVRDSLPASLWVVGLFVTDGVFSTLLVALAPGWVGAVCVSHLFQTWSSLSFACYTLCLRSVWSHMGWYLNGTAIQSFCGCA